MKLSEKLKQGRQRARLTQVEVAESLHVSRKTISGWENGRGAPDRAILVQLSQLYQVPIAVLIDDDQELDLSEAALQKAARRRRLTQLSYWLMVHCWARLC